MAVAAGDDTLLGALRRDFGHDAFREGQREIVEAVVAGRDVVVVMPTGGGKSLCYQLPAVLDVAPTVVVSPLIALMKDQVDALTERGLPAAALNSNLDAQSQRRIEDAYAAGALRLLYVAPERLVRGDLRALLLQRPPARIVVDEAHCISEWGHDFRRDYLRIGEVAQPLRPLQIVACTATATPAVRADIVARLDMRDPFVVVRGFARPTLFLGVERVRDEAEKLARLESIVDPGDGHAIVYAGTRRRAAAVAERLARRLPTMLYHADLGADERAAAQERFASGAVRVAVATSAFGMGVDVATVRQVVHIALPASLEEYYQQAGRAGRDGHPARCVVLHHPADRRLPEFFIEAAHPDAAVLAGVLRTLRRLGGDPGGWALVPASMRDRHVAALSDAAGNTARTMLADAGVIDPGGGIADVDPDRLPVDHGRVAAHRRVAFERFGGLLEYLAGGRCRHRIIVEHFGEVGVAAHCGAGCDVCAPSRPAGEPLDSITVRKALSGVARLNGRVGVAKVAAVLVGSRARGVADLPGAVGLSTYGALRGWREQDAIELLRRLAEAGALRSGAPPYPTVSLTRIGIAAMRGESDLVVEDPRALRRSGGALAAAADDGEPLDDLGAAVLDDLRAWRSAIARAKGWPAYMVFSDRTLRAIAALRPRNATELLAVSGVGPGKLAIHGDDVLGVVATACRASGDGTPDGPLAGVLVTAEEPE